ncbi:MAG: hypothetical protein IJS61_05110 [Firmicutes bacterium]|nr:hypothetical protein [Bacillota bacterium]
MEDYTRSLFSRIYQSYVTGGEYFTLKLSTLTKKEEPKLPAALEELENEGLAQVLSRGSAKIKIAITDKGIDFGNTFVEL